ncbi:MAG: hypothetical protein SFX18_18300 [Pirellulales bacterium]|nr:hypothetical protein [Pirellulales bacterium]
MSLFNRLSPVKLRQIAAPLAQEVTQRVHSAALCLVTPRVSSMTFPQARGYVRSKVGGLVRTEISQRLAHSTIADQLAPLILELSLESLTQIVLGQLLKQERVIRTSRIAA